MYKILVQGDDTEQLNKLIFQQLPKLLRFDSDMVLINVSTPFYFQI